MNKPDKDRKPGIIPQLDNIPFLNGGLFEQHENDYYENMPNPALVIPNGWFEDFLGVLERYNFTIDENSTVDADVSVDPEMLGRIFENLLAEVVPETGETARKATGSYYTPRVIVDYMVEQSLKQYLLAKTSLPEDKLDRLFSYEDDSIDLADSERNIVVKALKEIKVIDPACGSGAFPMGILHRMLLVLEKVDPRLEIWRRLYLSTYHPVMRKIIEDKLRKGNEQYIRKLTVIQDSIYGVDIQPIAVDIAKLRCFLSLVVDELVLDNEENRGIEPLPNLEFKFVAANSLIGLSSTASQSAFGITATVEKLKELRETYLRSFGAEKFQIEKEFRVTQQKLFDENVEWALSDTQVKRLIEWDPFSYQPCGWFDPDWMFGVSAFDVVIANPPYKGESSHKEVFREIKKSTLGEFYQGKMDIFYFFFHLAINIGTSSSQIAFISTDYYPTATGARKLRQDLSKRTNIRNLIDFNELRIFESAKGQHNMISIMSKLSNGSIVANNCRTERAGIATPQILQNILDWQDNKTNYYQVQQKDLYEGEECYIRITGAGGNESSPIQVLLNKVKRLGTPLGRLCIINQGVVSGCDCVSTRNMKKLKNTANIQNGDGIFVFDLENKRDRITIAGFSAEERKLLRPFFKNTDTKRYWCKTKETKLLLYLGRNHQSIQEYPNVSKYLQNYCAILEDRREVKTKRICYFQLQWPRTESIFTTPKITVPYRSKINSFAYNEIEWFCRSDSYVITSKDTEVELKYVLSLLNSKLYYMWLYHKGKRKGDALELFQVPLSEIPIKKITFIRQKPFVDIVDQILAVTDDDNYFGNPMKQSQVKEYERQIDQLVYELYGLTTEEIAVVEGSTASK